MLFLCLFITSLNTQTSFPFISQGSTINPSILRQDDFVLVCVPGYNAWLISAPTRLACERLEAAKKRPKGKHNFTHAIGDLDKFYNIIDKECIPPSLDSADKLKIFEQSHICVAITQDESVNNILVRNGMIQGTLWSEADFEIRNFFKEIEAGLEGHCDPDMINGHVYHAALVTSANFHGEGNIEDFEKAKEFGMKIGVKLCISFEQKMDIDPGCWSIFEIRKNSITATRKGTMHSDIIDRDSIKSLCVSFAKELIDMLDLMNADTDINDVYNVFESIDSNGDGGLTEEELCNFINQLSANASTSMSNEQKITDEDVSILFRAIDINGDKEISFVELFEFLEYAYDGNSPQMEKLARKFLNAVQSEAKLDDGANATNDVQNLICVFSDLDTDGSNDIDEGELGKLLFKHGFSEVEVKLMFSLMDKVYRSDGGINFTELFEFLKGLEKAEESILSKTCISTAIGSSLDEKKRVQFQ